MIGKRKPIGVKKKTIVVKQQILESDEETELMSAIDIYKPKTKR